MKTYREVKTALLKANINVFYKLWASGETFSDVLQKMDESAKDAAELKTKVKELIKENEKITKDNDLMKKNYDEIKASLDLIKKGLNPLVGKKQFLGQ